MSNKLLLNGRKALNVIMAAAIAIAIVVAIKFTAITCYAETAGKINATGTVNVRADASTTSDIVTTKNGGESIQILGQKTGADGYVWYQIYINATTVGYVRSDFATITDGTIPDTINADGTISSIDESVTKVNPISGAVTGGQAVRVRSDASTSATIVSSASSGQSLTVNGTKVGTDDKTWYYVEFNDGTNTVKGFIRSDFIELSGDLVEVTEDGGDTAVTTDTDTAATTDTGTVEEVQKDYDTELENGVWYLMDYNAGQKYSIDSMFEIIDNYQAEGTSKSKGGTAKTVWLIIFIIIAIAAIGAAAYFYLKLREVNDKEAFAEADRERKARTNGASRPQTTNQQRAGQPAQRTAGTASGQRSTGTVTGQRPSQSAGQRTVQGSSNGQRTVSASGNVQRPVQSGTQRPVQSGTQRPVQSGTQRPVQSGAQRPVQSGAQRPVQSGTQRPVQSENGNVSRTASQTAGNTASSAQKSQTPKNGYDEDDDFEFGFLNWDDDEKK